jgi:methylenetetrahydrofolate--tRNA-(uracil-5-)-methyltransferase
LNVREHPHLFVAGVLAGTEGYLESSATGWLAGTNAARQALGLELITPPEDSMLGGLVRFLATANPDNFQPMNANWSLVPAVPKQKNVGKSERRTQMYQRGLTAFKGWLESKHEENLKVLQPVL